MALQRDDSRRATGRQPVLKTGQIVFHGSVIDCVLLDISTEGARVRTPTVTAVPEKVTLRVRGGAVFPAVRRWARGTEIGLAFAGSLSLAEERMQEALAIGKLLRDHGLNAAVQRLAAVNFFDDPELRRLADEAEAAHARLETALAARAGTGS